MKARSACFSSRITPLELVLSKFCSAITQWLICICAVLPMFMLPLLIGGVTRRQVILMMLLLTGACFLSASIGLTISVLVISPIAATVGTFLLVSAWFSAGALIDLLFTRAGGPLFPGSALTQIMLLPLALAFFLWVLGFRTSTVFSALLLWTILALTIDSLFGAAALFELKRRLRQIAAG